MKYENKMRGLATSPIGLGCSRLGSMTAGRTPAELKALIAGARDLGVNVFDTANIYGQGRSERLLGEVLQGARDVCIITKAGQVFPLSQRLLLPLRQPVVALLKRSPRVQGGLKAIRSQGGLPRNFRPEHLRQSLLASLKRLRREQVDVFLLHSPRLQDLADGSALDSLVDLKQRGLTRLAGVSCDDQEVLDAVCDDPRVDAIQAPFGISRRAMEASLARAAARGAVVIAREIFSADPPAERRPVEQAVSFCVEHAAVDVTLVGTTSLDHLRQAAELVS